ncbi:hypothetical protein ACO0R3_002949 [Hanseniaspora guilliermondii]
MTHFKTDFINSDNKFKIVDDLCLMNPAILDEKLDKKMRIETHTFYIHVFNNDNKETFVIMIQILLSNVLDGLQKSTELLFSIMNSDGKTNTFLKQKVKTPIGTGKYFIEGKNLKYKIEQECITLCYDDDLLSISLRFDRENRQSVKILPFDDYESTRLTNGEIEHVFTLGLDVGRNSYIKYNNNDMIKLDDEHRISTSYIIAMQNGLPYKLVDSWKFFNKVDFDNNSVELIMEYGFTNETLSTCIKLYENGMMNINYGLIKDEKRENELDNSLDLVRNYEILKELPKIILILMKKLTNNDPVLKQYCRYKNPSMIYELTTMKK